VVSTEARFLADEKIPSLLKRLKKTFRVLAPERVADTVVLFREFSDGARLALAGQASLPPKEALFPQTERLLSYAYAKDPENLTKSTIQLNQQVDASPTVLFGARPCDVRGLMIFDAVFTQGQWQDPSVKARRDATTICTLLCDQPESTCFCTSVGGSPTAIEGSDLALTPVRGGYVAEANTAKGKTILQDEAFTPASAKQVKEAKKVRDTVGVEGQLELDEITQKIPTLFSTAFWEQVSAPCISCGACTYVCPACYCFNITDEPAGMSGERIRTWDSCMFYQYTLEASGHNPRPTKAERYRNRIGHKFSYHPTNYEGTFGCSGCGRCIKACPVSLDIRQVLREATTHG
jgi:sulfhydrogenase subunit beta (sulfur reductase)